MRRSVFVLAVFSALSLLNAAELPAPVKTNYTMHDYRRDSLDCDQRAMSGQYFKTGQRNPAWDDDAVRLLDAWAIRFNNTRVDVEYKTDDDTSNDTMLRLSFAGELRSCKDPLVLYARAITHRDRKETQMYEKFLCELIPSMLSSQYAPHLKYFALTKYLNIKDPQRTPAQKEQLTTRLYNEFADYLAAPVEKPIDRRFKAKNLFDEYEEYKNPQRTQVLTRLENLPNVDPWVLHIARGIHHYQNAWEARGNGFSNTVTQDGWKTFSAELTKSREYYEAAYKLEPTYPESADGMIRVAMCISDDDCKMRDWFDRAIAAQLDYMPAWRSYENGLMPRWHGSQQEMYDLGKEALRTGRFDTAVPGFYIDIVYSIIKDSYPGEEPLDLTAGAWADIKAAYDGYLKKPASQIDVRYWRSRQLAYAYRCQAYEDCMALLQNLGSNLNPDALENLAPPAQEIRAESIAMLSDRSDMMRRARRLELSSKFAQASRAYKRVLEGIDQEHPAYGFATQHAYFSDIQTKLSTGVKVELPMAKPDSLLFWRDAEKTRWRQTDEFLEFNTESPKVSLLRASCPVPKNIRVKLEWNYSAQADRLPAFYIHLTDVGARHGSVLGLQAFPRDGRIQIGTNDWRLNGTVKRNQDLRPDVWHTWIIERRGQSITVEHDGKPIINHSENWIAYGTPMLAISAYPTAGGYTFRVRNITIEQLGE